MKIVAIIPSRFNSSRFKGKPLALINGKPMIQRVFENVSKSSKIENVYVATDDTRIKDTVLDFGGKALLTSSTHRSGTDRVNEASNLIGLEDNDLVINIQGDQPLINMKCIKDLINPFLNNKNIKMCTLAYEIENSKTIENPKDVKVTFDFNNYALYFSRSNIPYVVNTEKKVMFYKHLGLYAYKRHFLETFSKLSTGNLEKIEQLEQLRAIEHGYNIFVSITQYDSPEVDLPSDIKHVEKIISNN